jgi:hypothetical protein
MRKRKMTYQEALDELARHHKINGRELSLITQIRAAELISYLYKNDLVLTNLYRGGYSLELCMVVSSHKGDQYKSITLNIEESGEYTIFCYSHRLTDLTITTDNYLQGDSPIDLLEKGVKFMHPNPTYGKSNYERS